MGCLESIEDKYDAFEERCKQIFEADKHFVDNMKTVSLTHVYQQQHLLYEFQFMKSDDITRANLRKFMLCLREVDFILMSRIFYELIGNKEGIQKQFVEMGKKTTFYDEDDEKKGQVVTFTIPGVKDIRMESITEKPQKTAEEQVKEGERVKAERTKLKAEIEAMGAEKVRFNKIYFKMAQEYEAILTSRAHADNEKRLKTFLWQIINKVNDEAIKANTECKANPELKKTLQFVDIPSYKGVKYLQYWLTKDTELIKQLQEEDAEFQFINADAYWRHFKQPKRHTPKNAEEFAYKLYSLEYEKVEETLIERNQNSFERKLVIQTEKKDSQYENPIVRTQYEEGSKPQDVRFLDVPDAYHNYAKYLEEIAANYSKIWQAQFEKWQESQKGVKDNREKRQQDLEKLRGIKKQLKDAQTANWENYQEEQAKENKQKEADKQKRKQEREEKIKKDGTQSKDLPPLSELSGEEDKPKVEIVRHGDKKMEPINDTIDREIKNFINYIKKNKNQVPDLDKLELDNPNMFLDDYKKYFNKGLKMVAKGRVALVLMAGGSDIKWGYQDEKTPFAFQPTGLNSGKCLIQLFCERVEAIQRLAHSYRPDKTFFMENSRIHVYVMTNSDNDQQTRRLFRRNLYFGLWKANIHFFCQPTLPCLSKDGELRLRDRLRLHMLPDGTGGVFDALQNDETVLQSWKLFGIKYVHIMGVDNLLGRPCDPTLLGMLRGIEGKETGVDVATKVLDLSEDKDSTLSRVCLKEGKPIVVRSEDLENTGTFQYGVYNDFACTLEFIEKALASKSEWETLHVSKKYLPFYQPPKGADKEQFITTDSAKTEDLATYVFERDIFDPISIVHPKRLALLSVNRYDEYAPIKKANPEDPTAIGDSTFRSAIVKLSNIHARWLLHNGYQLSNYVESPSKLTIVNKRKDQDYQYFLGNMDQKEWDEILAKREAKSNPVQEEQEKKAKKPKAWSRMANQVKYLTEEESDGEPKETVALYENLVEIDTRASVYGENIPEPRVYAPKVNKDGKQEGEPVIDSAPLYVKCNVRPIKFPLPWKFNQIYRYM